MCFFRVGVRGGSRGIVRILFLASSSEPGDGGETGLGSGVRDRVDSRVDGALKYGDRRRWRG